MSYRLVDSIHGKKRNNFVKKHAVFSSFLSSRERVAFNRSQGHTVHAFGIEKKGKLIGLITLIETRAKRGVFRLAPHSPIIDGDYFRVLKGIMPFLKKKAKESGVWFLRVNGVTESTQKNLKKYKKLGFRFAPIHMHAEETNLLALFGDDASMLKDVKKGHRYIINRARREGVTVTIENSPEMIDMFIAMHLAHARRTNGKLQYTPFTASYIRGLFEHFGSGCNLFVARYEGEIEAMCVTVQSGKQCVYYLGASDIKHPKFSPAYLCQWDAIQYARETGAKQYNFWGVSPDDNKNHPLYGVSFFKRGFGGEDFTLLHAHDYVFSQKYWFTRAIESIRRIKRGYYYIKPTK